MVKKIISGGQTGADQAGLAAGRELSLLTGGTAPHNWWTDSGYAKSLLEVYGLKPGPYDPRTYPMRTEMNVIFSHGTVIFGNTNSPGTRLTITYCVDHGRPYLPNPTPQLLRQWCIDHNIEILNVAGNRERTNPGIFERTKAILIEAFKES